MRIAAAGALLLVLPRAVGACAACIASAAGDQTYNWAYLGLILTPFAVGGVFAAVLTHCWLRGRRASTDIPCGDSPTSEETR